MLGALGIRVLVARGRRVSLLPVRERSRGLLVHVGSRAAAIRARDISGLLVRLSRCVLSLPAARTYEEGLSPKTGIPGFRDIAFSVSSRTGEDTLYSFIARYRPEEPVSVSESCTGTSRYTSRPKRPGYGPRQRMRPTGRDIKGSGACLHHHTTD